MLTFVSVHVETSKPRPELEITHEMYLHAQDTFYRAIQHIKLPRSSTVGEEFVYSRGVGSLISNDCSGGSVRRSGQRGPHLPRATGVQESYSRHRRSQVSAIDTHRRLRVYCFVQVA